MRSSKSRSRGKSNRNRSMGNIVNRVFESSGPEGKVRGTPQQIIDKYNQLAHDTQLSGDRVAAENFQQHAEHYLRMLGAAQKEQEARREDQERQNRERQAERDRDRARQQERDTGGTPAAPAAADDPAQIPQPDVIGETTGNGDSGLVETPESKPAEKPKRPRKPRAKKQAAKGDAPGGGKGDDDSKADSADGGAAGDNTATPDGEDAAKAAE
ncbi:MAG: DUF4167 domain-containing protein [Roseovarius sp.]|nr:DUF4167 domain-containing protein [Roseovarius sp.]